MALWGNADNANSAPKFKVDGALPDGANLYNNTGTYSVFGANVGEVNTANGAYHSPGWIATRSGTGGVTGLVITTGGTGYANTDLVRVSGGTVNASATVSTNSTGGISTVTITNGGSGFINVSSTTVAVTNSTGGASAGSNAAFTVTLGGKAGRVWYEVLVALKNMTS